MGYLYELKTTPIPSKHRTSFQGSWLFHRTLSLTDELCDNSHTHRRTYSPFSILPRQQLTKITEPLVPSPNNSPDVTNYTIYYKLP